MPRTPASEVGDQILSIQGIDFEQFSHHRRISIADLFGARRRGARPPGSGTASRWPRDVRVRPGTSDRPQVLFSTVAPLIFWLMGTVVIIFLRPRDERWLVLVLFSYVTAIWIAAGIGQRAAGAALRLPRRDLVLPAARRPPPHHPAQRDLRPAVAADPADLPVRRCPLVLAVLDALFLLERLRVLVRLVHPGGRPALASACSASGSSCRPSPPRGWRSASCCSA